MNQEEIKEGNKLIAMFMEQGYWQVWTKDFYKPYWADGFKTKELAEEKMREVGEKYKINYFETNEPIFITPHYNEDWNDLMSVVEKIENIKAMGTQAYIDITPFGIRGYCSGHIEKGLSVFSFENKGKYFTNYEKKNAVWEIVIEFIKWYNGKQKNEG